MSKWLKYGPPWYYRETKPLPINPLTYYDKDTKKLNKNFASFDSPERFSENLKTQPLDWHYRNKKIEYNVNQSGYRTKEWKEIDWEESIVILGCSTIFGVGVAEDETIDHHLSKLTGRSVVNLGAPSASNYFICYNSFLIAKNFPVPWAVIHAYTGLERYTFFNSEDIVNRGIWNQDKIYLDWVIGDGTNPIIHNKFLAMMSKMFWSDKTNFFSCSFFEESGYHLDCQYLPIDNQSRDLIHPSSLCSRSMAELIYENIK
jgi:hypothetical protein